MCYVVPTALWKLIDDVQKPFLKEAPIADAPVRIIAPLPPELEAAWDSADQARERVQGKIQEMYRDRRPRSPSCGHGPCIRLQKKQLVDGMVRHLLIRPHCNKATCPHCWRRRLCKTLRRMINCLLDVRQDERTIPRTELLHIAEYAWSESDAFEKKVRRAVGSKCGRARIRQANESVLLIAEKPFPSSRAVTPSEAVDLAAEAIGQLHRGKHSYRQLGAWNVRQEAEHEILDRGVPVSPAKVGEELERLEYKVSYFSTPDYVGLSWRVPDEQAGEDLWKKVLEAVCPSLAQERDQSPEGSNVDSNGPEREPEWIDPFG
jgi:hypothetical protein